MKIFGTLVYEALIVFEPENLECIFIPLTSLRNFVAVSSQTITKFYTDYTA